MFNHPDFVNAHPDVQALLVKEWVKVTEEKITKLRNKNDLGSILTQRTVKGYLSRDEHRIWWDAKYPPHGALPREHIAEELEAQAKERYQTAIRMWENPADQIANFERAGVILQEKQLRLASAARRADTLGEINEIGIGGARGGSKTFGLFAVIALDDCQRFPGLKMLYLRKVGKDAREQMVDLVAKMFEFVPHKFRSHPSTQLDFPNGSRILIGHFNNEKEALSYQGLEYDGIVIEEATHLSFYAYETLKASTRTSKQGWRPRAYNSTNPGGLGHNWYKKRFVTPEKRGIPLKEREALSIFIPSTVDDNRHVDEEYVMTLDNLKGARKKMWRYGDWDVAAGAYFSNFNHDIHVIENWKPEDFDGNDQIITSMDYGYKHWNMWYLIVKRGERTFLIDEMGHRMKRPEQIGPDYFNMLARYELEPHRISVNLAGADVFSMTGHSGQTIAQKYAKQGIYLVPAFTDPGSRVAGANEIAQLLGDPDDDESPERIFFTKRCERLIETLPTLQQDPNNPEDVLKVDADEQGEGGDDSYDGSRYGIYTPHLTGMASGR